MTFSEILSQENAVHHLQTMLKTGRIPPALLFHGPAGCGKYAAALSFAAALNCTKIPYAGPEQKKKAHAAAPDDLFAAAFQPKPEDEAKEISAPEKLDVPPWESCGKCLSCIQLKNGVHPDIIITGLSDQAAKTGKESGNLKVDTMREMLKKVYQRSFISPHKVFIVRDAEKLLPEAQNSLLKTLEAPPDGTIICLLSSDKNALLPTILSRSTEVTFSPLSAEALKILLEREGISPENASFLAQAGQGSLDKARNIKLFMDRAENSKKSSDSLYSFTAMLSKESHKAREETNALLDLMIYRLRTIWKNSPGKQRAYARLLRDMLELRSFTNRNVSSSRILQAALLGAESAGIKLEQLLGE